LPQSIRVFDHNFSQCLAKNNYVTQILCHFTEKHPRQAFQLKLRTSKANGSNYQAHNFLDFLWASLYKKGTENKITQYDMECYHFELKLNII